MSAEFFDDGNDGDDSGNAGRAPDFTGEVQELGPLNPDLRIALWINEDAGSDGNVPVAEGRVQRKGDQSEYPESGRVVLWKND